MFNFRWGMILAIAAFIISITLGIITGVSFLYITLRALLFALIFFVFGTGIRFIVSTFFPELLFGGEASQRGISDYQSVDQPGSRINITVGNTGEYAVPAPYQTGGKELELGNIEDLISGYFRPGSESSQGIDREEEDDYNNERGGQRAGRTSKPDDFMDFDIPDPVSDFLSKDFQSEVIKPEDSKTESVKPVEKPVFSPSFGDDSEGLGGLPDLDAMAKAFSGDYIGGISSVSAPGQVPVAEVEQFDDDSQEVEWDNPRAEVSRAGNKPQPLKGDFNAEDLAKGIRTILSKDDK